MSYFCGIIENEITYRAYKYLIEAKVVPKGIVDWGYDGFTIPPPAPEINFECSLKEMNQYVRTKTGFKNVEFVVKGLDGVLDNVILRRKTEQVSPLSAIIESEEIEETYYKGEILDDDDAISKIWGDMKKFVKYYEGQYFMKKGNIWVVGDKNVASSCFCYFMKFLLILFLVFLFFIHDLNFQLSYEICHIHLNFELNLVFFYFYLPI